MSTYVVACSLLKILLRMAKMLKECYCTLQLHDEKDSLGLGTLKTTRKQRINTSCVSQVQMFQLFYDENNVFRSMNKSKSTKDFTTFYEFINIH